MSEVIIPSSPTDRKKIKEMLGEICKCMQRIDDERSAKKDIVDEISQQFKLPKKLINKLASTMHKRSYEDVQAENEDFEIIYESVVEGKSPTTISPEQLEELVA